MADFCTISFPATAYPTITLAAHQPLSQHLTIQNSPLLFGCRTGICGTCLVKVRGDIPPPQADERELLDTFAPQEPLARLACQIELTADIQIYRLEGGDDAVD